MAEKVNVMIDGKPAPIIAITTGQAFNFWEPELDTIHLDDIAESLSKDARYTGKTPGVFYSVAEHSVNCSYIVSQEYALQALMHDAAEAFTGDFTSPLKKFVAGHTSILKEIDLRVSKAIFKKFGIEPYSDTELLAPCVHDVDQYMYLQERYQLCNPISNDWWDFHGDPDPDYPTLRCHEWRMAKHIFIKRFNELFYATQRRQSGG